MPPLRLLPDLEQALAKLPGVRAVSVVTDAEATPIEVHVVAAPGKPAKQLVRDVQSLALAEQGIALDHRIVSVVQLDDPVPPGQEPIRCEGSRRAVLEGVIVGTRSSGYDAAVTIVSGGNLYEGVAEGPVHGSQRYWLVARAALDAMSEPLGVPCRVEHASIAPAGDHRVALVVLVVRVPGAGDLTVSGSAIVRVDEPDAVARAVLDALNRRLEG